MIIADIVKIFIPATLSFALGITLAPLLTHYLYKYQAWKKSPCKTALDGAPATEFGKLRKDAEVRTPRMGGLLIWVTAMLVTLGIWFANEFTAFATIEKLDFLSRSQTWIPLVTLIAGGLIGFVNDLLDLSPGGERGIPLVTRLFIISLLALFIGWWFYAKLEVVSIGIPLDGELYFGWLIIPLFIALSLGLYAGGVIDGIDGLAGGVFAAIFASYAGIAFLWFNIPPARFWMTETGTMGLTLTLAVIAFMTDTLGEGYGVAALPLIALPLFATVASNVLQIASKRFRGKKLFRIAPLHHHFEAIGWPPYKVTMRYW